MFHYEVQNVILLKELEALGTLPDSDDKHNDGFVSHPSGTTYNNSYVLCLIVGYHQEKVERSCTVRNHGLYERRKGWSRNHEAAQKGATT
jgi:hypothetical protein